MKHRRGIPAEILDTVHSRKCAECDEPSTEVDHILPISEGGTNDIDNLQALCGTCHATKTRNERLTTYKAAGYSEMSTDVLEAFVAARKPSQLVFGNGASRCYELDIINSRRWAVQKTSVPLPIACVLDTIEDFDPDKAASYDYIFIDAGPPDISDYFNYAAYQGPRWYPRECAMFVCESSVLNEEGDVITIDNCVASFTTHEHMQPEDVASMYDNMEATFLNSVPEDIFDGAANKTAKDAKAAFFKKLCLSMQGSWLTVHQYSWQCVESTTRDDVIGPIKSFTELGNGVHRYNTLTETLGNRSMYLFGLFALSMEQLTVCKAIQLARQLRYKICGVLVDGLLLDASGYDVGWGAIEKAAKKWLRPDGTAFIRIKMEMKNRPFIKRAPENAPKHRPVIPVASVWRSEDYTMKGNGSELLWPRCSVREGGSKSRQSVFQVPTPRPWYTMGAFGAWLFEPRFVFQRHWTEMTEEPGIGGLGDTTDTFQETVAEAAFQNGGAFITGGVDRERATPSSYLWPNTRRSKPE